MIAPQAVSIPDVGISCLILESSSFAAAVLLSIAAVLLFPIIWVSLARGKYLQNENPCLGCKASLRFSQKICLFSFFRCNIFGVDPYRQNSGILYLPTMTLGTQTMKLFSNLCMSLQNDSAAVIFIHMVCVSCPISKEILENKLFLFIVVYCSFLSILWSRCEFVSEAVFSRL